MTTGTGLPRVACHIAHAQSLHDIYLPLTSDKRLPVVIVFALDSTHPADPYNRSTCSERGRTVGDEGRARLGDAMRERELEVGGHQLLDVRPTNVVRLFNFDHTQDLDDAPP